MAGALIGGFAAAYSVERSAHYQARAQADQFREDRQRQQRELRAEAYVAFHRAAESYLEGHRPASACRKLTKEQLAKVSLCSAYIDGEDATWLALRTAAEGVYLYGSAETRRLVESVLGAARDLEEVPRVETELSAAQVRLEAARAEYQEAEQAYRAEVQGAPGSGRTGVGPNARRLQRTVDELSAEIAALTRQLGAAQQSARTGDERLQQVLTQLRRRSCLELNPVPSEACAPQ